MAQVECDAQSHGCGTGDGTIGGILAFPGLHMKKGFRTPPKTLTVELAGFPVFVAISPFSRCITTLGALLPTLP